MKDKNRAVFFGTQENGAGRVLKNRRREKIRLKNYKILLNRVYYSPNQRY